jgi:hypothetical protein
MTVPKTHRLTKLEIKLLEMLQFNVREMEPEVIRERYLSEAIERKKLREKEQAQKP